MSVKKLMEGAHVTRKFNKGKFSSLKDYAASKKDISDSEYAKVMQTKPDLGMKHKEWDWHDEGCLCSECIVKRNVVLLKEEEEEDK
jgi:hypothetical protein